MKKNLVRVLLIMSVAAMSLPIFASSSSAPATSGMKILSEINPRAVEYVGGGEWDYGVINGELYSGYYHAKNKHSSTAVSYYGTDKDIASAGNYSDARVKSSGNMGTNKVYWDNEA